MSKIKDNLEKLEDLYMKACMCKDFQHMRGLGKTIDGTKKYIRKLETEKEYEELFNKWSQLW